MLAPTGVIQASSAINDLLEVVRDPKKYQEQIGTLEQLAKVIEEEGAKNQQNLADSQRLHAEAIAAREQANKALAEAKRATAAVEAGAAEAQRLRTAARQQAEETDRRLQDYDAKWKQLQDDRAAFDAMRGEAMAKLEAREQAMRQRETEIEDLQKRLRDKLNAFNNLARD